MDFEHIIYSVPTGGGRGVATITLNRPDRLNALSPTMRHELLQAVLAADADTAVGAIVITGAGRGFCSGGDMKAMNEQRSGRPDSGSTGAGDGQRPANNNRLQDQIAPIRDRVVLAMREATKPVIAAVNGPAAGAGMNIALACDIRIASTASSFGQTFSRRGLHPDWGGTYFLPRIVGTAMAAELIWSGRMIDAEEALRLGIVSRLTAPEDLLSSVDELAQSLADGPPVAVRLAKRAIYKSMESDLRQSLEFETYAQNLCATTKDASEGIAAFVEKRQPEFGGS